MQSRKLTCSICLVTYLTINSNRKDLVLRNINFRQIILIELVDLSFETIYYCYYFYLSQWNVIHFWYGENLFRSMTSQSYAFTTSMIRALRCSHNFLLFIERQECIHNERTFSRFLMNTSSKIRKKEENW